ncbi:type VII secretion integral membrane protein EccD [Mycobacterium kyorinense]|uniref:Type VII secretion integral membrane protein EccD n=1 Tax=Mycobacterium kyorinense TaxID=487514 RepID=A0A1A2ZW46_9MYCO|nr:type VII secretion integral membrane protein EccD [Mycobacterium kyorinense]
MEVFIDDIVELLGDELKRRGLPELTAGVGYELHKVNGVRLDISKTFDELGIEDGATLVLAPATHGESFEPQYESLSTGLARIGKKLFEPVTADTAVHTALAILAMAAATAFALALRARARTDSLTPTIVTGALGVLAGVGLTAVWLRWPHRGDLLDGFSWIAVPLLAGGAAGAAPGRLGSAHVFIAALAVAVLSWAVTASTRRRIAATAAIVTLCGVAGGLAAARMWRPFPAQWLGMCTLVALLVVLTAAPTIALWAARIRPPHFGSVTGRDLFRRRDGLPVDTVSPVDAEDEVNPDTTPRGKQIAAAAVRANGVLTGICVGAALALPAGAWVTLMPGQRRSPAAATLAGLFVLIFISRGRAFTDRRQAVALVCGAAAAACAGVAKCVLHQPSASVQPVLWAAVVLAGFGGTGLATALLVPITKFTPLVRMLAEWLELAAIAAALPLAAWIGGLFSWVRMR